MSKELYIFLIAASPLVELRGAIPLAFFYKFTLAKALFISIIGNILPVPFLLWGLEPLSRRLRKLKIFNKFFDWLFEKTKKKAKLVERFEALGLVLFVSIPLPGTGAWTGSVAASLFGIRFSLAISAICLGVVIAGIVVSFLSLGSIYALKSF